MPPVKLEIKGKGVAGQGQVLLDGKDISNSVFGVTLNMSVGDINTATLEVYVTEPAIDAEVQAHLLKIDPRKSKSKDATSFASRWRELFTA